MPRTLQSALEMEGSLDTLLIRHPDGHETVYDGSIGAVHALDTLLRAHSDQIIVVPLKGRACRQPVT